MKKNELVVKSNRLVEASYRLGLNEQRIILYAICRCREEQKGLFPDLPVTITADSFAKQFPSIDKTNVYRQLKEAMDALYERSVTIHDIDPASGHARVKKTRWVSEAAYVDGAGNVQVIFTPEVIKYVTRLEAEFTSYQLEKVGHMTSAHAVRIYELLTQHREIGSRTINLKWLRETLQIEADEYKLTADFIKRVIGVPGDTVKVEGDNVYINGQQVDETYLKEAYEQAHAQGVLYNEIDGDRSNFPNIKFPDGVVPEGTVFVMGDNRDNSEDSRMIGYIPMDRIVGRADLIFWPIKDFSLVKH